MTYQIWTRLIITSLILLGDSAAASEIRLRSGVAAIAIDSIIQISQSELHDDVDNAHNPILNGSTSIQGQVTRRYQPLATLTYLDTPSDPYELYHSRAPPVSL